MNHDRLSTWTLIAFAGPSLVIQLIGFPVLMILPTYYAEHTLVSLAAVGTVLGATRLVDAFTDPLVGVLTDRTKSRWGGRKPWLVVAAILGVVGIHFLFGPSTTATAGYLLGWTLVVNLAWTCFNVPHNAWASELSRDYRERSRIFYFKGLMGGLGTLAFLTLPQLPAFRQGALGAGFLETIAWTGIVLLPVVMASCLAIVPRGREVRQQEFHWRALAWSFRHNRPLWLFLGMYCLGGIATGISIALTFLFIKHYLKVGDAYPIIMGVWAVTHFLGMPLWLRIVYHLGKPRALAISWGAAALVVLPLWLVSPGPGAVIPMATIFGLRGFLSAAELVVPGALFGDVIDYDILRSRSNQSGTLFAFMGLLVKGCVAAGSALGFLAIAGFGYSVAADATNSAMANTGLKLTYVVVPILLYLCASACIWRFPIGPREHAIIRRRIERMQARELRRTGEGRDAGRVE